MTPYKLYGMPASLYTAKARSYLRKRQVPFIEYGANHPDFATRIAPAVGRWIVPVLEAPDGTIIQDGSAIIDYLETNTEGQFSAYPSSALARTVSLLFEMFGGEGLLRPAMHYRWNFDAQNMTFIRDEFISSLAPIGASEAEGNAFFDNASGRMRGATASFGVAESTKALIEASYVAFLTLFSAHLKHFPYLLGGRPTIGDFGLVSALYAHLDRDPAATTLMRQQAPAVSRWVERMNAPGDIWVEHAEDPRLMDAENVPTSLKKLMIYVAEEYLPEITAHVAFANEWLAARPTLVAGTNGLDDPANRYIGSAEFTWRGTTMKSAVLPYRFYLLQRIQDCFERALASEQLAIRALFDETGLAPLLALKTVRRVARVNHFEVWGELRDS